jgi:abortive infection bacteriophage resistance protein
MATMLTTAQQVELLKQDGVKFTLCSEQDAYEYLRNYYGYAKLKAYFPLFARHLSGAREGQFINLEFEQLKLVARLDDQLRQVMLPMTLGIEQFHKEQLLVRMQDAREDDALILKEYLASLTEDRRAHRIKDYETTRQNLEKAEGLSLPSLYEGEVPITDFLNYITFGTLIDVTRFCANRWSDKALLQLHYDLKDIKATRNSCAHSATIIGAFAYRSQDKLVLSNEVKKALATAVISKRSRDKWMRCKPIKQIAATLIIFNSLVPPGDRRNLFLERLRDLFQNINASKALLNSKGPDAQTWAALAFIKELTTSLNMLDF